MTHRFPPGKGAYWVLLAILVAAFALRVVGLGFGLPARYHPDESRFVRIGFQFLEGNWRPTEYANPAFFKYVIGVMTWVWYKGGAFGDVTPPEVKSLYRPQVYYMARFLSAAMGTLTIALLYPLGHRLFRRRSVGLIAAVFLAGAYLHVRSSHFAVSDVLVTLLMTLALYTSAGVWRYGRWFDYSLTGLLIGLAVATKYSAALAGVWLLVAHFALRVVRPRFWRRLVTGRLVLAGFLIPITFLATAPYTLIDWPDFIDAVNKLRAQGTQGVNGELFSPHGAWIYYFQALSWGVGWLLLALSLAGLIYALFCRGEGSQANWFLIALPILFYLYMGRQLVYFARYLLPVLPPLLLLAAHFMDDVLTHRSLARFSPKLVLAAATVVCLAQPVAAALRFDSLLTRPDTRVDAQAWVDKHTTPEDIVAVERYSVDEPNDDYDFIDLKTRGFADKPLSFYSQQQVQYVVISSFVYQRVKIDPVEQQERSARLQTLFDSASLVYEVQPFVRQPPAWRYDEITGPAGEVWFRHRPGPIIEIYRLEAGQW